MMHQDSIYSPNKDQDQIRELRGIIRLTDDGLEIPDPSTVTENIMYIDAAIKEMQETYKERLPYIMIPTLGGNCYKWSDTFIYNFLVALSTDALIQFSSEELTAFWNLVAFEDFHSHSADADNCNGLAIGCTIPDEKNKSYVVCKNYEISDELCNEPLFNVVNQAAWKSLDNLLMDLYWCREIDDCDRNKGIKDISPCPLAGHQQQQNNGGVSSH